VAWPADAKIIVSSMNAGSASRFIVSSASLQVVLWEGRPMIERKLVVFGIFGAIQ
jgi:hypothetical protein